MPIYDYQCNSVGCGNTLEMYAPSDSERTKPRWCKVCEDVTTFNRLIGASYFILKGEGFYKPNKT